MKLDSGAASAVSRAAALPTNAEPLPLSAPQRFAECLVKIAQCLTSNNMDDLQFLFRKQLHFSDDWKPSPTQLFLELRKQLLLKETDASTLRDALCNIKRLDLANIMDPFLEATDQQLSCNNIIELNIKMQGWKEKTINDAVILMDRLLKRVGYQGTNLSGLQGVKQGCIELTYVLLEPIDASAFSNKELFDTYETNGILSISADHIIVYSKEDISPVKVC